MSDNMLVEVKLILSKRFPPGTSEMEFSGYRIRAVPASSATESEAILSFLNTYEDPVGNGSNPEGEANIICRLLALFFDTRIKIAGFRVKEIDIPIIEGQGRTQYPQFFGILDPSNVEDYLKQILSLDKDLARQFVRASHTYSFAVEFIPSDPTFVFFLLVVAVECMSSQNKVISFSELESNKKCERFCRFVISFFPEKYKSDDERNAKLFGKLLKTIYHSHRSGFVHGGKEVSSASLFADKTGSSYFKHYINGKKVMTPGLAWCTKIVRGALLGYLDSLTNTPRMDNELLARLAFEKAVLNLKVKEDMKKGKGQFVTQNDIEYR